MGFLQQKRAMWVCGRPRGSVAEVRDRPHHLISQCRFRMLQRYTVFSDIIASLKLSPPL